MPRLPGTCAPRVSHGPHPGHRVLSRARCPARCRVQVQHLAPAPGPLPLAPGHRFHRPSRARDIVPEPGSQVSPRTRRSRARLIAMPAGTRRLRVQGRIRLRIPRVLLLAPVLPVACRVRTRAVVGFRVPVTIRSALPRAWARPVGRRPRVIRVRAPVTDVAALLAPVLPAQGAVPPACRVRVAPPVCPGPIRR